MKMSASRPAVRQRPLRPHKAKAAFGPAERADDMFVVGLLRPRLEGRGQSSCYPVARQPSAAFATGYTKMARPERKQPLLHQPLDLLAHRLGRVPSAPSFLAITFGLTGR